MEMTHTQYNGREAVQIENQETRLTVTLEGGHIAEILHKESGVNPLWSPPWRSIEPSEYSPQAHPEFGNSGESRLLSGMMGHILCLDLFGSPSASEAAAGMPVHGEAVTAVYQASANRDSLTLSTKLEKAEMQFERTLRLAPGGIVHFCEVLENLSCTDRPIAWTQHVTLGAPFLELGSTCFQATATRSKVIEPGFNDDLGMQKTGAEFDWPCCPRKDGKVSDFRTLTSEKVSGGFTAHLMDQSVEQAGFAAWSPRLKILFGYRWNRKDFPWLARWEENHLRSMPPWSGRGFAIGMEFGVSPMVESRLDMVARATLFGAPTFRWLPAKSTIKVEYSAFINQSEEMPEWNS
jgi:hypothetical protein